jgi:hypothetical protein
VDKQVSEHTWRIICNTAVRNFISRIEGVCWIWVGNNFTRFKNFAAFWRNDKYFRLPLKCFVFVDTMEYVVTLSRQVLTVNEHEKLLLINGINAEAIRKDG